MTPVPARCHRSPAQVLRLLASAVLACVASACATPSPAAGDGDGAQSSGHVTFIVVRHAEKASDDPRNPSLSADGHARAARLAARWANEDVVAAYATQYRRTAQTLQPTVAAHGIALQTYEAGQAASDFAAQLVAAHRRGTVLVAGHSNTVPDIVATLCACPTQPMPENEYDRISTIRIDAGGRRVLDVARDPQGPGAAR